MTTSFLLAVMVTATLQNGSCVDGDENNNSTDFWLLIDPEII